MKMLKTSQHPYSDIIPMAGNHIEARLKNFMQWSDISAGYTSAEDLINSCDLDAAGKVSCAIQTTDLIAESYAAAARVYLHCRLYRYVINNTYSQKSNIHIIKPTSDFPAH